MHLSQQPNGNIALPATPISPLSHEYPLISNISTRTRHVKDSVVELCTNNVGLLLIAASQLFMTFMNVSVKFLNKIDEPISTLEVV